MLSSSLCQKIKPQYPNVRRQLGEPLASDPDLNYLDSLYLDFERAPYDFDEIIDNLPSPFQLEVGNNPQPTPDFLSIHSTDQNHTKVNEHQDCRKIASEVEIASTATPKKEEVPTKERKSKSKREKTQEDIEAERQHKIAKASLRGLYSPCMLDENDCMLERGTANNKHAGTIKFRQMVQGRKEQYKAAKKKDKSGIAWDIIAQFKASGRFLIREHKESDIWYEVEDKHVYEKVMHRLRDVVRGPRKKGAKSSEAKKKKTSKKVSKARSSPTSHRNTRSSKLR